MKKIILSIIAILACAGAKADDIRFADPTIFYEDGVYYLTGTGGDVGSGYDMMSSTDLVHWKKCGNAAGGRVLTKNDTWGTNGFWAPQVFKHDSTYYMAYCANEQIAIAKSNSPMGPYYQEEQKKLNGTTGQIDPYVFIDDDGKKYIYYVRFIGGNSLYVGELSDDFSTIEESTIKHCISAEDNTWETSKEGGSSPTKIAEGPTVIKDGEYYFLIYSANDYQNIDYSVGYAYAKSPMGPWKKVRPPFITRHNTGINGSGHGDMFRDTEGNYYYVFHVHASNTQVHNRRTAIVPITLTDDPDNKFVPDMSRMYILKDAATTSDSFPTGYTTFEEDGMTYYVTSEKAKTVEITYKDPVNFGGYRGTLEVPETISHDGTDYTVTTIGISTFYSCPSLRKITLPSTLKKIGTSAFEDTKMTSIDIPESVTSIGYRALKSDDMRLITVHRSRPINLSPDTFSQETLRKGKLTVPAGSLDSYRQHAMWGQFLRIEEAVDAGINDTLSADDTDADVEYTLNGTIAPKGQKGVVVTKKGKFIRK